jgi:hypothetical protein
MIVECGLQLGNGRKESKAFNTEGTEVTEPDSEETTVEGDILVRRVL